jgi:hypothetical protein
MRALLFTLGLLCSKRKQNYNPTAGTEVRGTTKKRAVLDDPNSFAAEKRAIPARAEALRLHNMRLGSTCHQEIELFSSEGARC